MLYGQVSVLMLAITSDIILITVQLVLKYNHMIELFREAQLIVIALNGSGVNYALCGGIAVGVHGYIRATEDIDIVISSATDLEAVDAVLKPVGRNEFSQSIEFDNGFVLHRRIKIVGPDTLCLDLLIPPQGLDILADRMLSDLQGAACWIVSKASLRIMKADTGRQKDLDDLKYLDDVGDIMDAKDAQS